MTAPLRGTRPQVLSLFPRPYKGRIQARPGLGWAAFTDNHFQSVSSVQTPWGAEPVHSLAPVINLRATEEISPDPRPGAKHVTHGTPLSSGARLGPGSPPRGTGSRGGGPPPHRSLPTLRLPGAQLQPPLPAAQRLDLSDKLSCNCPVITAPTQKPAKGLWKCRGRKVRSPFQQPVSGQERRPRASGVWHLLEKETSALPQPSLAHPFPSHPALPGSPSQRLT